MFAVFVPRFAHINSRCRVVCVLFCICPSEVGDTVVAPYGVDVVNAVLVGQTVEKSFGDYRMHHSWLVAVSGVYEHHYIPALLRILFKDFFILDAPYLPLDADLVVGVDGIYSPDHSCADQLILSLRTLSRTLIILSLSHTHSAVPLQ